MELRDVLTFTVAYVTFLVIDALLAQSLGSTPNITVNTVMAALITTISAVNRAKTEKE